MTYAVTLSSAAARELRKLDRPVAARILGVLGVLGENPRPPASRQLIGRPGVWRVRSGDHRVLYEIRDDLLVVLVLRVGHRRQVYDR